MDQFFHIRMLLGIILGLSLTQLLKGVVKFIEHPHREKIYLLHLLWAAYLFLSMLHFWWWEFGLTTVETWNFFKYAFLALYTTCFFVAASVLFPESMSEYNGYKDYFFSRKKWLFGILATMYLMDVLDTLVKGFDRIHLLGEFEYFTAITARIAGSLLAIKINNERFHYALVTIFILYRMSAIYRQYASMR